jgi:hypothetical protein
MSEVPDINAVALEFTAATARGQRLCFFMCDRSLQESEVATLEKLALALREAKRTAIIARSEEAANLFLGFESLTRAVTWELKMWIALKDGRPHDAWEALVEAQEHACLGLRTPAGSSGVAGYVGRLSVLEETLFPVLQFMSAGLTHEGGTCSICGQPFTACSHVAGRIYCGRVCAEVELCAVTPDHAALVKVPQDKRCYVTQYTDGGVWRDAMTRTETGDPPPEGDDFQTRGVVLSFKTPPGVNV